MLSSTKLAELLAEFVTVIRQLTVSELASVLQNLYRRCEVDLRLFVGWIAIGGDDFVAEFDLVGARLLFADGCGVVAAVG
jgi:hypothetical protein